MDVSTTIFFRLGSRAPATRGVGLCRYIPLCPHAEPGFAEIRWSAGLQRKHLGDRLWYRRAYTIPAAGRAQRDGLGRLFAVLIDSAEDWLERVVFSLVDKVEWEPCINTSRSMPGRGYGSQLTLIAGSGKRQEPQQAWQCTHNRRRS